MTTILPSIVDEGQRLLDQAHSEGTTLALLGGVAVRLLAHEIPPALDRDYKDLDPFVGGLVNALNGILGGNLPAPATPPAARTH